MSEIGLATESTESRDAPYGQFMFFVFAGAVVLVSSAVALLSLVHSWWMLGLVFALHATATVIVTRVIARALNGHAEPWLAPRSPAVETPAASETTVSARTGLAPAL